MDKRDKRLLQHHLKRLRLAQALTLGQRVRWANKELHIAEVEHRILMYVLAQQWLIDLDNQLEVGRM